MKMMFEEDPMATVDEIGRHIDRPIEQLLCSLWICQLKDDEMAALDGIPLTLDTHVEAEFTHQHSFLSHLEIISLIITEEPQGLVLNKDWIAEIWETLLAKESNSIPEAKSLTLSWFIANFEIMDRDHLAEKLSTAGDNVKELPKYNEACDMYM